MTVKAFDLVPAIDRINTAVECLECSGNNLYIGTQESFVLHYVLEEKQYGDGAIMIDFRKENQKYLETKKPITILKTASVLSRILLLCDANLMVLDMSSLEVIPPMSKLKGVSCFCLNENPETNNPFAVEICIAKRKQLLICHVTDDKIQQLREVNVPEPPLTMSMDGLFVCLALSSSYVIVEIEKGRAQDLVPYDSNSAFPLVKRITKEEFLLAGPSGLGVFVTTAGISERPPLSWGEGVVSAAYTHPYVLALSSDFLTVYSILDQQVKQRITFHGGSYLDNFDGKMYVASSNIVCALLPVPWEKQVQALLSDKKVAEALELAKYSKKSELSKEQFRIVYQRIQQQAGFIEFSLHRFEEARELFHESQLDPRELISLYPDIFPSSSSFSRGSPPLHDIANVQEMCGNDYNAFASCRKFLLHYLEAIRNSSEATGAKLEIDTALLKLYAEMDYNALLSFLSLADIGCQPKEGVDVLIKYERYHALALFHLKLGEKALSLEIWSKIISGEYSDSLYPGVEHFVEFLSNLSDHLLLWKYVDFVLEINEALSVKIFINRPASEPPSERLRPDFIVEYLHRYPIALVNFLEYLVIEKKLEKEKFHTHLAVMYMDSVLQILKLPEPEQTSLSESREKLQQMLHSSNLYRVQLLLGKALDNGLHKECAILYGKLEEHEKAIRILVHQLRDHDAAEDYCLRMSQGRGRRYRHRLFYALLTVYLDSSLDEDQKEELLPAAIQLLNSELAEFDVIKVLQLLPPDWSVAILDQFLTRSLRNSLHHRRLCHLQSALSRGQNLQLRFARIHAEGASVLMTEDRVCDVCRNSFAMPVFARHSSAAVTHPQCAKYLK